MKRRTTWGYAVETGDDGVIPPIITGEQFATATKNRYSASDPTVLQALDAVSMAVRRHCGWHVAPVLQCEWIGQGDGSRIIRLPALEITGITAASDNGEQLRTGDIEWRSDGLVKRLNFTRWSRRWGSVTIDYTAGFEADQIMDLVQTVAQITASNLAAAAGVQREQAGQVSITYNQTAPGVSGGITLLDRDKELLAPFRLTRSF
ncbi:hypothetical protein [Bifidobacterium vansinderenii]|uniref:Uncharacterized protein n=1 Tax=Bifidobacterium vansinderenii TaxID=1984871 RepID=A0A229VWA9_9BIFI|nr:hypothetical protein [Bifidobacterium vansinderenii]OXM99881.1 hypothetical protein Tam10B_1844 [Bifidobacterium vansinderenii]